MFRFLALEKVSAVVVEPRSFKDTEPSCGLPHFLYTTYESGILRGILHCVNSNKCGILHFVYTTNESGILRGFPHFLIFISGILQLCNLFWPSQAQVQDCNLTNLCHSSPYS